MTIKNQVIELWSGTFEETLEEKRKCPECEDETVVRRIVKEPQQKYHKRWFVEWCTEEDCPHWTCGFLPKRYKPKGEIKWVKKPKSSKDKDQK